MGDRSLPPPVAETGRRSVGNRKEQQYAATMRFPGCEGRKSQGAPARLCELPMPKATIEIPIQTQRVSALIAETLLILYRNRNSRLTAPLRFLLFSALHASETLGLPP